MNIPKITIVKVGGKVVENPEDLEILLTNFSKIKGNKILVHGGGRSATKISEKLGIETHMIEGRRITDAETIKVVTMVYAGLVNKNIVAKLQALNVNAIGLTGADLNLIHAIKRPVKTIDYGFVGDIISVQTEILHDLLSKNVVPVIAPLTHDKNGVLLNTNADTIASELACELSKSYNVDLIYCFEKKGVLSDINNEDSVISEITKDNYENLKKQNIITDGMIPKLDNSFNAIVRGVKKVVITNINGLDSFKNNKYFGTELK